MVPVARGGSAADANTRSEAMRLLRLRLERATTGPLGRIVLVPPVTGPPVEDVAMALATELVAAGGAVLVRVDEQCTGPNPVAAAAGRTTIEAGRSEERRGGKASVSKGRHRGAPV